MYYHTLMIMREWDLRLSQHCLLCFGRVVWLRSIDVLEKPASLETSVIVYQTTVHHIQNSNLHSYRTSKLHLFNPFRPQRMKIQSAYVHIITPTVVLVNECDTHMKLFHLHIHSITVDLLRLRTIFNLDILFGTASFKTLVIADTSESLLFA